MTRNIWPRQLQGSIKEDRRRKAEVKVYNKLRDELDDSFHVFYSSPWIATDRFGVERDGECDFLVAHQEKGILAIEVKGGGIAYDPEASRWTSTDAAGVVHTIKDPVAQARSAKYNILTKLSEHRRWQDRYIGAHHGVIFPDAATPASDLGADRPAKIFCASRQFLESLSFWVNRRFEDSEAGEGSVSALGRDGISALEDLFARPFTLDYSISSSIAGDMDTLLALEPEQFHILEYISDIPRVRIRGAAGTGKTVLALQEVLNSSASDSRTLLTCYNSPLASDLVRRAGQRENLEIGNFHAICGKFARIAGVKMTGDRRSATFYEEILPEKLIEAVEARPDLRFDLVVVDEGQDFSETWWTAIEYLLKPNGKLRIFYDCNQRLYDRSSAFLDSLNLVPIPLTRNLRNTKKIHDAAMVHYDGPATRPVGPDGLEVQMLEVKDESALAAEAYSVLRNLVFNEEVNPAEVAIIVPNKQCVDELHRLAARSNIELANADDLSREKVIVDTLRRFKGLERAVVVLCMNSDDEEMREAGYTGMTRARAALTVIQTSR